MSTPPNSNAAPTPTLEERWRALLEAGRVRWTDGMMNQEMGVYVESLGGFQGFQQDIWRRHSPAPNWKHGGTLGELLAQVREAWERPDISAIVWDERDWGCTAAHGHESGWSGAITRGHASEAEALIAALEAA